MEGLILIFQANLIGKLFWGVDCGGGFDSCDANDFASIKAIWMVSNVKERTARCDGWIWHDYYMANGKAALHTSLPERKEDFSMKNRSSWKGRSYLQFLIQSPLGLPRWFHVPGLQRILPSAWCIGTPAILAQRQLLLSHAALHFVGWNQQKDRQATRHNPWIHVHVRRWKRVSGTLLWIARTGGSWDGNINNLHRVQSSSWKRYALRKMMPPMFSVAGRWITNLWEMQGTTFSKVFLKFFGSNMAVWKCWRNQIDHVMELIYFWFPFICVVSLGPCRYPRSTSAWLFAKTRPVVERAPLRSCTDQFSADRVKGRFPNGTFLFFPYGKCFFLFFVFRRLFFAGVLCFFSGFHCALKGVFL